MSSFQAEQTSPETEQQEQQQQKLVSHNVVSVEVINTAQAELENDQRQAAPVSTSSSSIIVVSRGVNEGDPPLWTIVNNSSPMNSAVNVITGTRITHGHPLLLG